MHNYKELFWKNASNWSTPICSCYLQNILCILLNFRKEYKYNVVGLNLKLDFINFFASK
jgi:hypothetical protein